MLIKGFTPKPHLPVYVLMSVSSFVPQYTLSLSLSLPLSLSLSLSLSLFSVGDISLMVHRMILIMLHYLKIDQVGLPGEKDDSYNQNNQNNNNNNDNNYDN